MTDYPRLSLKTLDLAVTGTQIPRVPRDRLRPAIVHLGLGAFARAHLAQFTDDANVADGSDWGIIGVSLQRPDQRDRLLPQDGLYVAIEREGDASRARIENGVLDIIVAPEEPGRVIAAMADPLCRIVSLTITEKGYCLDPATGDLRLDHPDIAHDLGEPDGPRSAIGFIVAGLARRRAAGLQPFTVMSCDNLPHNGRTLERLVSTFAGRIDADLALWIAATTTFPSTMVDRIVPATTDADLLAAAELTGLGDAATVVHEPFRQWVIEDRFVDGRRPAWQHAGAEMVADVSPFETMKLRMLNGTHSAIAYLGYLAGHATVREAVADPAIRTFITALWHDEIVPVLPPPPGVDLIRYAGQLMRRYDNAAIHHRTWQIASDGSQKLPQRLLETARARLALGLGVTRIAHAIAAWIIYVGGTDLNGQPIDVRDPLAADLKARLSAAGGAAAAQVEAILAVQTIFGADLGANSHFNSAVTGALVKLRDAGVAPALAALSDAEPE